MPPTKNKPRRSIIIVLDSCGIGALPDAAQYGDIGSNTLANTALRVGGMSLPNLQRLGLGNIESIYNLPPITNPLACHGKMAERSIGKDSTNGHWEMMGVVMDRPMPVYPHGFPSDLILEFERRIGRKVLGNKPASGTEIIKELGAEHLRTGYPIVYTSADSVFQIAAHATIYPIEELYHICEIAREMLRGEHAVGRVIARPFIGEPGAFVRTEKRKDFSLKPPSPTLLDCAQQAGLEVCGVGKVDYLFANHGITRCTHVLSNDDGINKILSAMDSLESGILLANMGDFDTLYGHRNDPLGFARALEAFDSRLPEILSLIHMDDTIFITADHGCDPTMPSTDHSREYVPILAWRPNGAKGVNLGIRSTFADLGSTVAQLLSLPKPLIGESFAACL